MEIEARISSTPAHHVVSVSTNGTSQTVAIPARSSGPGCSLNGGELLLLALATCYCNDIHREAALRHINLESVDVVVSGAFGGPGEPEANFTYEAVVKANAHPDEIEALMVHTDTIAEIHSTLRAGATVTPTSLQAISTQ